MSHRSFLFLDVLNIQQLKRVASFFYQRGETPTSVGKIKVVVNYSLLDDWEHCTGRIKADPVLSARNVVSSSNSLGQQT